MFSPTMPMNTEWFKQKLAERKLSQRQLAKQMDLDPAAISLTLRGMRKMTNEEAHLIASKIGVPVTEVLRQAGIEVLDDVRSVPVTGYVGDNSVVTLFPRRTADKVIGPADCPAGTYALQIRIPNNPKDGWMYFISPAEEDPKACVGRLCVIALDNGEHVLSNLQRGYRTGTFNLIRCSGAALRTDATVAWASHILWIKPT